jgi:hypothetical protein
MNIYKRELAILIGHSGLLLAQFEDIPVNEIYSILETLDRWEYLNEDGTRLKNQFHELFIKEFKD